jgi:hypothetical protein
VVTEKAPPSSKAMDINELLKERGPEFLMAMDIPRIWANGAQVLVSPDSCMIIFREQNAAQDETGKVTILVRNVASLILPTDMIRELHRLIGDQLALLDVTAAK